MTPTFFFSRSLPFLIFPMILKNKKNLYEGSFNFFSYYSSGVKLVTGVRDLEVALFKANST